MRISIRQSAGRLRAVPRVAQRRAAAAAPATEQDRAKQIIDFSVVHGRHCICDRCGRARAGGRDAA